MNWFLRKLLSLMIFGNWPFKLGRKKKMCYGVTEFLNSHNNNTLSPVCVGHRMIHLFDIFKFLKR